VLLVSHKLNNLSAFVNNIDHIVLCTFWSSPSFCTSVILKIFAVTHYCDETQMKEVIETSGMHSSHSQPHPTCGTWRRQHKIMIIDLI